MDQHRRSTRIFVGMGIILGLIALGVLALTILRQGTPGTPTLPTPTLPQTAPPTLSTTPSETPPPTSTESPTATAEATPESTPLTTGETSNSLSLLEIEMMDAQQGWALGSGVDLLMRVLRTADGGLTWRDISPPRLPGPYDSISEMLWSLNIPGSAGDNGIFGGTFPVFLDNQHAWWFDGESLWSTEDGGESWTELLDNPPFAGLISFADPLHGWIATPPDYAAGNAFVDLYQTTDGGHTWDLLIYHGGRYFQSTHLDMQFIDAQTGLEISQSHMISPDNPADWWMTRTADGGKSWDNMQIQRPLEVTQLLETSQFPTDPGVRGECTASPLQIFPPRTVLTLETCTQPRPSRDMAVYDQVMHVYRSDDLGQTWHATRFPEQNPGLEFCFDTWEFKPAFVMLDPNTGWVIARKDIYQTLDGGSTWTQISSVPWYKNDTSRCAPLAKADFVDASSGWIGVWDNETRLYVNDGGDAEFYQTLDGGHTWTLIEPRLAD